MTEVKVKLSYVRLSPRKTRLLVDILRGLPVVEAEAQLQHRRPKAAPVVLKLLRSAVAAAINDFKLAEDNLLIKRIMVDGGPVLKRYKPRAFGRAGSIRKPTSHITIVLGEIKPTVKAGEEPLAKATGKEAVDKGGPEETKKSKATIKKKTAKPAKLSKKSVPQQAKRDS